MSDHPQIAIGNGLLSARISPQGAELQSLVPAWGDEMMWAAEPQVWGWHAPNLFPVVGGLAGDSLLHQGRRYPMKSHGFLRHSLTRLVDSTPLSASFQLTDSPETRGQYPFAFRLTVTFRLEDDRLVQAFAVENPAAEPLLVSLGAHPAFRWPLRPGLDPLAHLVAFEHPEPQGIRRVVGNGLGLEPLPTPVEGRVLRLSPALFETSAMVWDRLHSGRILYGIPGGPGLEMQIGDFPHLGIWSKPGPARFLCLEPWQGHMSPVGFDGEFATKPGVVAIPPGVTRVWSLAIRPLEHLAI